MAKNVLITGAAGFLGRRLAERLLAEGVRSENGQAEPVGRLILSDRIPVADLDDDRVEMITGDIAEPAHIAELPWATADIIYHLAAVVSGEAERDFDLGMRVNIDASRALLEACRATGKSPRVIFTSSVAVFGPDTAGADVPKVSPLSSYGMEKAVAELLLQDFSRRGFVDGLVLRLPTISIRPGKPNQAASSFASGIIREPLAGLPSICPVDPDTRLWLLSPRGAIGNLLHAASLGRDIPAQERIIDLPGLTVTVREMLEILRAVAGEQALARVEMAPDAAITSIVANWPSRWDDSRARALGFAGDRNFEEIVRHHMDESRMG